jgi:methylated-DNA-[protein]-cysteine S-methyltransferase
MDKIIYFQNYKSPVGDLILGENDGKLCMADWKYRKMRSSIDFRLKKALNADFLELNTDILQETKKQLDEYFLRERVYFDLPLVLAGTHFQQQVWNALLEIEFGQMISYQTIANRVEKEKAVRAVASAIGANAISIIVPCHRVIGSDGKLTGYAGGLPVKKKLLALEQQTRLSL